MGDFKLLAHLQYADETYEIVVEIAQGVAHGFTDSLKRCKVNDGIDGGLFAQYFP